MKWIAATLTVVLLGLAVGINAWAPKTNVVEIAVLDASNWDEFVPHGKEVDAIYQDYVLRNEHLVAVIAQPVASRNANMTVRDVGGCLIDLTVRDRQSDQLSAFYPGDKEFAYRSAEMRIDGKATDAQGVIETSGTGEVVVRTTPSDSAVSVEVAYQLTPSARNLNVVTTFTNNTPKAVKVPLQDAIRADSQKDDMPKSPNGTMDMFWFHDQFWGQAYGFEAAGLQTAADSNSRTTTLRYQSADVTGSIELQPGQSFELRRRVLPGADLPQVRAVAATLRKEPVYDVRFEVTDGLERAVPNARIALSRKAESWGMLLADKNGLGTAQLPEGRYEIRVATLGTEITPPGLPELVVGPHESKVNLACTNWNPGTVVTEFTDSAGEPIPCKIDFLAKEGTPQPWFGPETADYGVNTVQYAPHGVAAVQVPPGDYRVVISHGPEHDAIFKEVTVPPGEEVRLSGVIPRVVDTTGWISTDFHSHSSPSGDNTGSQLGRVLNLVCDHVEFAPCTEHNRIDTYQPHIDSLNIGRFLKSCTGMELTGSPLPLNHQNAFPLIHRPHQQDGGGPVTDTSVVKQIERLALWDDRSEKLVQVNHPDMGWLFRDSDGDGTPDDGNASIMPLIDVVEIHPVPDILTLDPYLTASTYKGNNRIFNWLQMLNQGHRIVGVCNTDAHYNYHESGWLRNWVRSPTDDPAAIQTLDVVRASEAGAVVLSTGPFLEVSVREVGAKSGVMAGQDLVAKSGKVVIDVKVQCPNYLDIDRVFVLVNGRIHDGLNFRRSTHPDLFRSGVVKFQQQLELTLDQDAHVIVATGGENSTLGDVHGPRWGKEHPAAFINPVFVDIDGNGFKANGDTLGYPLPVKYAPPKN